MSYTHTEPFSTIPTQPSFSSPFLPSLDSAPRSSTRSSHHPHWKQQQILLHNQQLLKQNQILSKRLAQLDKGIILSSHRKQKQKESERVEMSKMLVEMRKERDELRMQNRELKRRMEESEKEKENRHIEQSSKSGSGRGYVEKNGLQQIEMLQKRLEEIQKNGRNSEEEMDRMRGELERVMEERDRILETYEKEKQITQQIVRSMKTEIESNREKQRKVVDIVKILEKQKRELQSNYQNLLQKNSQNSKKMTPQLQFSQSFASRLSQLTQLLSSAEFTITDLTAQLIKKDHFISKTMKEHKSRLTKALQSYIERIGISQKLKPAELLRERSTVLSEWDLGLDTQVECE